MNKIVSIGEIGSVAERLRESRKNIVLVGGCFDLLHQGHRQFLTRAKKIGDVLIVLLESDERIRNLKGKGRPVYPQLKRATDLAGLQATDFIVILPKPMTDGEYDELISAIKPAIIATTKGDPFRHHKERQALLIDASVADVIERLDEFSTTSEINGFKYE